MRRIFRLKLREKRGNGEYANKRAPHALAHPNFDKTPIHSTWTTHASKDQKDFYWFVMYGLGKGEYEKNILAKTKGKKGQWDVSQQVKRGLETKKQSGEQQN